MALHGQPIGGGEVIVEEVRDHPAGLPTAQRGPAQGIAPLNARRGPTPESDLHVSVVDAEVGQVGSRVELFEPAWRFVPPDLHR